MVRANATGRIDYKALNFQDINSHLVESYGLKHTENEIYENLLSMLISRDLARAVYAPPWLTDNKYHNNALDSMINTYSKLGRLVAPWLDWTDTSADKIKRKELLSMVDRYKELVGDPDSPEMQEKIARFRRYTETNQIISGSTVIPKGARWVYR